MNNLDKKNNYFNKIYKKTIFILLIILTTLPLASQEINLSNSSENSEWPAIAVNSRGEIMVAWSEWGNFAPMWYRIYRNGEWSIKRNSNLVKEQAWSNKLDVDSNGRFHVSFAHGAGSQGRDIWYSYFNGESWASPEEIYRSAYNSAWNWMSIDKNNDIHIMWYHRYNSRSSGIEASDVVTMKKRSGGSWPRSYDNASRNINAENIHPAFRARNENIYAVYMGGNYNVGRKLTYAEKLGGSWSAPIELAPTGYYPGMDIDSQGNVHIAYSSHARNFYSISKINGQWTRAQIISDGSAPLQFGDIRYRNGVLVAVFTQKTNEQWVVYYTVKFGNNPWSKPVQLSSGDKFGDGNKHCQVILDYSGNAHFLWEGAGVSGRADILYKKVKLSEPEFPFIEVNRYNLDFKTFQGDKPGRQSFGLRNSGKDAFQYQITSNRDWISVQPAGGTATNNWESIGVDINPGDRGPGEYNGTITVQSSGASNSPVTINVNLTIEKRVTPHIQLDKSGLNFFGYSRWDNPPKQSFRVKNSQEMILDFKIESNRPWIKVSPQYGQSTGQWRTVNVSVETSSLNVGHHVGEILVKDPKADNTPQKISINLQLEKPPFPFVPKNTVISKMAFESLFFKIYKNKLEWSPNSLNDGLFDITKYRIFRRLKEETFYSHLKDVGSDIYMFFDNDFSSLADRDKYVYAISTVDSENRESRKVEF